MKNNTIDLTQGSVPRTLLRFAWPMVLANMMQSVYGIVDLLIVGQFVGKEGLAGVSSAGSVINLILMLGIGFALGGQILIAQYSGMGAKEQLERTYGVLITFLVLIGVVFTAVGLVLREPLLGLINTPVESVKDARAYYTICMSGTIFIYLYNAICSGLRGMGDSKRPMIFVGVSCVMNIILDLVFVAFFRWGAAGAAAATIGSQFVACISSAVYLFARQRSFGLHFNFKTFVPSRNRLGLLIRTGVPCALQSSVIDVGSVLLMSIINSFGVDASAGYSVGGRVGGMLSIPLFGICDAASTMASQNFGAKNFERMRKGVYWSLGLAGGYALALALLLQFPGIGETLIKVFNTDPGVVELGSAYLRIFAFGFVGIAVLCSFTTVSNGSGNTQITMIANVMDGLVGKLGLAVLIVYVLHQGIISVFVGAAISPWLGVLVAGIYFLSGHWKKFQRKEEA